jgi:hypothetical protein
MNKAQFLFLTSMIILVICSLIFIKLPTPNSKISNKQSCILLTNSSILKEGDKAVLLCNYNISEEEISLDPSSLFMEREKNSNKVIYEFTNSYSSYPEHIFIGKLWEDEKGRTFWKKIFLAEVTNGENPIIESEGIMIKLDENMQKVRMWHWYIRVPFNLKEWVFVMPPLQNLTLLDNYLMLELYVTMLIPRNGTWWPLRLIGPASFNQTLKDFLTIQSIENETFLAKIEVPAVKNIKGVSIGYEGVIKTFNTSNGDQLINFYLGFNHKPTFYFLIPSSYELKRVTIDGTLLEFSQCSLSTDPRYVCYVSKLNYTILSTYNLTLQVRAKING